MASLLRPLPETPRGRSRFSKVLPRPPTPKRKPIATAASSPTITTTGATPPVTPFTRTLADAALPPLPKIMATIARRPVGGSTAHSKDPSIQSVSSVYSDSPGFARSLSNNSEPSTNEYRGEVDSENGPSPPLPPKDQNRPKTANNNLASSRPGFNTSPPRPEIWKRRSLITEKAVAFPELKLEKSNGSTASPPQKDLPAVPRPPLPHSITGRKPVPARDAPPQPDLPIPDLMGSKLSKLEHKLGKLKDHDKKSMKSSSSDVTTIGRLPTPEYQKTDKQQPPTPNIISPLSPETPPNDVAPEVPRRSASRETLKKSTNVPASLPSLTESSRTIVAAPTLNGIKSPQLQKPLPAKDYTPMSPMSPISPTSPTSPFAIRSAESPRLKFPMHPSPSAPGTVFPGPPLDISHLECYTSHMHMRRANNTLCPTGCMICLKKDREVRWRCTWCCVSACGSCAQVLAAVPGKDIKVVLQKIGH